MVFGIKITEFALIIESLVLILTLIILIIQIRKNTKAERLAQYQNALEKVFAYRSETIEYDIAEPEIADKIKSMLGDEFDTGYFYHTLKFFHVFELLFLLKEQRIIDNDMWLGWEINLRESLALPSSKKKKIWVTLAKEGINLYHRDYTAFIEGIVCDIEK